MGIRTALLRALGGVDARELPARAQPAPVAFHPEARFTGFGSAMQPNADSLLNNVIGWADIGIRAIADRISSLELQVVERRRDQVGTVVEEVIDDHELKAVLDRWCPVYSPRMSLRLTTQYLLTVGASYTLKVAPRGMRGISELYVMPANRIRPVWSGGLVAGFIVNGADGKEMPVAAEDVVFTWLPDPEAPWGPEGIIGPQAAALDGARFAQEHVRSHFSRDATPRVVIEADKESPKVEPDNIKQWREQWRQQFHGAGRGGASRGLPAVLPPGFSAKVLDAHESQKSVVPIMEFLRDQTLMALGVPRSIIGDVVDANRAAAETNQYVFDLHTVSPYAHLIAEALTSQLAQPIYGPEVFVRFAEFVSGDKTHELAQERQDLELKVSAINEIREARGMDPSSWGELPVGTMADQPYTGEEREAQPNPFDVVADAEEPDDEEPEDTQPPDERFRAFNSATLAQVRQFERGYKVILAAQEDQILRVLSANGLSRSSRALEESEILELVRKALQPENWRLLHERTIESTRRATIAQVAQRIMNRLRGRVDFIFTEQVVDLLERNASFLERALAGSTLASVTDEITRALQEGVTESVAQRAARIREAVGAGMLTRARQAEMIARTEMGAANQLAHVEGWTQSGVVQGKRWINSRDDAVRDAHKIDGQTVPINARFELRDGVFADHPLDPTLPARDRINCRCAMVPVLLGE